MESTAGLHYRFEAAAMFSALPKQKTARRAREHLVDLERSEQIYLVIRGEALKMNYFVALRKKTLSGLFVPFGSFFLRASYCIQFLPF